MLALSGKYGDTVFNDGVAEVTLKHGESVKITGLPADYYYKVTELGAENYATTVKANKGKAVSAKEISGKIPEGTATIAFVNTNGGKTPGDDDTKKTNSVDTGDHTQIALYAGMMMISLMIIFAILIIRRRKTNE